MPATSGPIRLDIARGAQLVGRNDELKRLEELLEIARSGRPGVAVVRGEAGIGKTRLLQELIARHPEVLARTTHCSQHLAAPYAPLVLLLRRATSEGRLAGGEAGRAREVVRRLTAAQDASLREEAPEIERSMARVRLFLELYDALTALVGDDATVIAVENVHWADPSTAQFLEFLARELTDGSVRLPLLLLLTRRELEPADRSIDRLERVSGCTSLRLHPLAELEVHDLVRSYGITRPSRQLVSTLYTASQGNPLHVQESLRRLDSIEAFTERHGVIEAQVPPSELGPPRDLTELLESRLDALPEAVREVLGLASVIGDGFSPALLVRLHAHDVERQLDRAAEAGLVIPRGDGYAFAHPLLRQVVYDGLPRDRRRALHRVVAEILTREDDGQSGRILEIGHHLIEGAAGDDERTLERLWRAGLQAHRLADWRGAIRFFQAATAVGERIGAPEGKLGWLRFWAGRSHCDDYDAPAALDLLGAAARTGRAIGDIELWSRAVHEELSQRIATSPESLRGRIDTSSLDEVLAAIGEDRPDLRAPLLCAYCTIRMAGFDFEAGLAMGREAVRVAARTDDATQVARAESTLGMALMGAGEATRACEHLERAERIAAEIGDAETEGLCRARRALSLWMLGRLDEAEAAARAAGAAFDTIRHRGGQCLVEAIHAALASLRGDFAAAERHASSAEQLYEQSEYYFATLVLYPALIEARFAQGDVEGADAALTAWHATGQGGRFLSRLVALVRTGSLDEARALIDSDKRLMLAARFPSMISAAVLGALADAASALGDTSLAAEIAPEIERLPDPSVVWSPGFPRLIAWTRGVVCQLLGREAEAADAFLEALSVAERANAPPEIARAHLELARLWSLDPAREREAARHAASAQGVFERLGMPAEQAACRTLLDRLPGPPARTDADAKFILITDIVNSTSISVDEGDETYLRLVDAHHTILRRRLAEHGGTEVDTTGDGMLAWLPTSDAAIRCALDVQDDVERDQSAADPAPLLVRVGVAAGSPIERAGRLYGSAVSLSERLCKAAEPGAVVVSKRVLTDPPAGVECEPLGALALKGFREPVEAYVVRKVESKGS